MLVFTPRREKTHVISLRKANKRKVNLDMKRKRNPERADRENPVWTKDTFARARKAGEVLPEIFTKTNCRQNAQTPWPAYILAACLFHCVCRRRPWLGGRPQALVGKLAWPKR